MGMDVYGKAPRTAKGEYFRNSVWWWHPLWDYCLTLDETLEDRVPNGHTNDGDGLGDVDSQALAALLIDSLETGAAEQYQDEYRAHLASLPMNDCNLCKGTGIRPDDNFVQGQDKKELSPEQQALYGRTHGWCNGCDGGGQTPHFATHYPFDTKNVREFADFLMDCGGFEIC